MGLGEGVTWSASCAWEVTAGLIPGEPMPEFTRRWVLSRDREASEGNDWTYTFKQLQKEAEDYARGLSEPSRLNWVRVDWVWF